MSLCVILMCEKEEGRCNMVRRVLLFSRSLVLFPVLLLLSLLVSRTNCAHLNPIKSLPVFKSGFLWLLLLESLFPAVFSVLPGEFHLWLFVVFVYFLKKFNLVDLAFLVCSSSLVGQ